MSLQGHRRDQPIDRSSSHLPPVYSEAWAKGHHLTPYALDKHVWDAVKIPPFVSSDPALRFGMLELTFELAVQKPITDKRTKYNYCVAHLSPDEAMTVRDVILSPWSTNPYSKLKDEVIARCGKSKSQKIGRLLAGEQI
ncbi:uncharacterized protein TNCV_3612571 [Trichonephila clavipes]|uniref:DUF7041 domain-containing protein n=1 Tax=Trichonephila clavipes TaxID=2585209 RepID=A0A8X6SMC7_TRICX|nr:uncharacterized protein TNCV_3612571 [Trichonephila clavipes]